MLTATRENEERITTAHRAKLAYVYIRQSTAGQVRQHQESTQLQYRLVGRATALGWPDDRIEVIDDDLGKSGISSDARYGFQRLIAEIGLGKAGLVLSLDASRLARNNRDWHQLLECARSSACSSPMAKGSTIMHVDTPVRLRGCRSGGARSVRS
jgi:DNA invertase Pin-like site-specific DNA recombinase